MPFRTSRRPVPHQLRLFVAGSSERSIRAVQTVKRICDSDLEGRYHLEVIDIYKEPARAGRDQIIAIPTLIKEAPGIRRRIVGDMSETALLRRRLDL